MYVGIDWAKRGWFAVGIGEDEEGTETWFEPTLWNLKESFENGDHDIDKVLIDIPIGLTTDKKRECDVKAKDELSGTRGSSVFYTPTRPAVEAENICKAKKAQTEEEADYGIQNQAWALVPQIREVDLFVRNADYEFDISETHPEVCFARLADGDEWHSKKSAHGEGSRIELLEEEYAGSEQLFETAEDDYREPEWAPVIGASDDILDALVAAVTARGETESIPNSDRQVDSDLGDWEIEMVVPAKD